LLQLLYTIGDIREDYEFTKELGSGAYGIVYEVAHKITRITFGYC